MTADKPQTLRHAPLDSTEKNIPYGVPDATLVGWNLLQGDLPFPQMVLRESALAANLRSMAEWCHRQGFLLAPHGKTTMCPSIFKRQMESGAWAMTVANASQASICIHAGVRRILIANQVVGSAAPRSLAAAMRDLDDLEIFCLVDSVNGVRNLAHALRAAIATRPIGVLVEMGRNGWRAGARTIADGIAVFEEIGNHPDVLICRGVEGFEGLAHSDDGAQSEGRLVDEFLSNVLLLARKVGEHLGTRALLSAGGSAFLDRILQLRHAVGDEFQMVVRSGCYVTHDHGAYLRRDIAAHEREPSADLPSFTPALELWSLVQSRPEPELAILNFGKRDCPFDIDLPIPLFAVSLRNPSERIPIPNLTVSGLNDQHAYLRGPLGDLQLGDAICCGISHPCTAFDKWRVLPVVDDTYQVLDWYRTYF